MVIAMADGDKSAMLLLQYFGVVGALLLSLLFIADAHLPRPVERDEPARSHHIRIASERKMPQAVTFSGHAVDYGRPLEHAAVIGAQRSEPALAQAAVPPPSGAALVAASASAAKGEERKARKKAAKRRLRPASEFALYPRWRETFASSRNDLYW